MPPSRPHAAADPVQALLERHQELYADAVDPLDIAAVLERSGIGPETAGRFRHADVFSLAEELHARVPRRAAAPPPDAGAWRRRARPALAAGAVFVAVGLLLWSLRTLGLPVPPAAQVAAFAAAAAGTLGRGLRLSERASLALGVGALLGLAQDVGPAQLALAAGVGVAEWSARWFRHLGWGHIRARSYREFRSRMRPVLPSVALGYLTVLAGLTAVALALQPGGRGGPGGQGGVALLWASSGVVWVVQLSAGAAVLVALLLRHGERVPSALAVLAASCACVALARTAAASGAGGWGATHSGLVIWACALTAGVGLPYAWASSLNPATHRPPAEAEEASPGP
ncbi:hypothetical protein [Streptacidiphilus jiangxiensis]|uniref:Uncharacterized protein n=1 Tax=Streptacidiphilus jiangxiensis TaxID=235985 RepID=A0A1H7FYZ7_STRJI|nr:hypothetical protein [Streptacidiphilus jiangxiensis]SEK29722.1 hypothetical protein SAMN05414137_101412 [Streptacidiphilus jiangxiensis]